MSDNHARALRGHARQYFSAQRKQCLFFLCFLFEYCITYTVRNCLHALKLYVFCISINLQTPCIPHKVQNFYGRSRISGFRANYKSSSLWNPYNANKMSSNIGFQPAGNHERTFNVYSRTSNHLTLNHGIDSYIPWVQDISTFISIDLLAII